MQQASSNLGQMITQDENRVRQARQDARQDKQDLLATPGTPEWIAAQKAQTRNEDWWDGCRASMENGK